MQRRDFLNGVMLATGATWSAPGRGQAALAYPPALTGLRGSAPGSMDVAHTRAWSGTAEVPPPEREETYDLVVVGGGISGLATAHFYRQVVRANARILILDNHDDFGGHARRNEFQVDGRRIVTYGGTQSLDTPTRYSAVARRLLQSLGVDLVALRRAYDLEYFRRHRLGLGLFYDAATFGRELWLASTPPTLHPPGYYSRHYVPGIGEPPPFAQMLERSPLTAAQRSQVQRLLQGRAPGAPPPASDEGAERPYLAVLREHHGVTDAAVQMLLSMAMAEDSALGAGTVSWNAACEGQLLGTTAPRKRGRVPHEAPPEMGDDEDLDGYFFHFPDGGATVARLLVQRLIPRVAALRSVAECVDARFDYARLDRPDQPVRLRLHSTAVQVRNQGQGTRVLYQRHGRTEAALAPHTVMAGWSMASAHVVQGLPERQKAAMRANLKLPMVYAQVALRRWHALQRAGWAVAYAPGSYFQFSQMDFPVTLGTQRPPKGPDEPAVLLMIRIPSPLLDAATPEAQIRAGRAEVLGADFAHYEEQVVRQLSAMYGPHGFEARRDIAALTIHRWGHGFVWDEALFEGEPAHVLAARSVGRIHMAGADSQGRAYLDAAIDAAWQAVARLRPGGA